MGKININDLFLLIFYCVCILCFAVVLGYVIAAVIVYFKIGIFNLNWEIIIPETVRKGGIGGVILGFGIWIKGKLNERKNKNQ
ncbi:hypothetical protein [Serratia aquatilis]|uniref:Uncharacterized protein n=1 Tax=Serratia aquatilis TaxID=1737515 RepID=A0ABV6EAY8_9GAMM